MAKLEAMLEQRGIATPREISEAIARCQLHGGDLTTSLLQFVSADETLLSATLSECYGLPAAGVGLLPAPDDAALRSLPREVAERYCCFPLETGPGRLVLAVSHPLEASLLDELSLTLGVMIEQRVALEVRIRQALARFYGLPLSARNQRGIARLEGDFEAAGHETPLGLWSDPQLSNLARLPSDLPPSQRDSQRPPSIRPRSRSETPRYGNGPMPPSSGSRAGRRRGPMSLAKAREELGRATTRNEVLDIFFAFASQFFEYSALFAVHNALAEGLDAWGKGADRDAVLGIGVPLDLPSSLSEAAESCKVRLTRLGKEGIDRTLMIDLQRQFNAKALVLPVSLRGRCAVLLYADNGEVDVVEREVADVIAIGGDVANALGRIILQRKKEVRQRVLDGLDLSGGLGDRRLVSTTGGAPAHETDPRAREGGWGEASPAPAAVGNEHEESVPGQRVVAIGGDSDASESRPSSTLPAAPFALASDSPNSASSAPRSDAGSGEDPVFLLARPQGKSGVQAVSTTRSPFPTVQKPQVSITHPAPIIASRPRLPSVIVDPTITDPEATERASRAAAVTRAPSQARGSVGRRPAVPPPADAPRSLSPSDRDTRPAAVALAASADGEPELEDEHHPAATDRSGPGEDSAFVGDAEREAMGATASRGWPPPIMDNSPPPRQPPLTALVPIIIADPPKSKRSAGGSRSGFASGAGAGGRSGAKPQLTRTGVQRTSSQPPATGREPAAPTVPSPARARRVEAGSPASGAGTPSVALDDSTGAMPPAMPPAMARAGAAADVLTSAASTSVSVSSVTTAASGAGMPLGTGAASAWRALSGDISTSGAASPNPATIPPNAASAKPSSSPAPRAADATARSGSEGSPAIGETMPSAAAQPTGPSGATAANGALPPRHGNALARAAARSSGAGLTGGAIHASPNATHPLAPRPAESRLGAGSPRGAGSPPPTHSEPPEPPHDRTSRPPLAAALAARVASSPPGAANPTSSVAPRAPSIVPSGAPADERSATLAAAGEAARDASKTAVDAARAPREPSAAAADATHSPDPSTTSADAAHSANGSSATAAPTGPGSFAHGASSAATRDRATESAARLANGDEDPESGERAASEIPAPLASSSDASSSNAPSAPGESSPAGIDPRANGIGAHPQGVGVDAPTALADHPHFSLANGQRSAFSLSDRAPDSAEISDPLAWPDTPPPRWAPSFSIRTTPAPAGSAAMAALSIDSISSRTSAGSFDRAPDSAEISDPLAWPDTTPPSPVASAPLASSAATVPLPAAEPEPEPEPVAERPSAPPPSRVESQIPTRPSRPPASRVSNSIPTRPSDPPPSAVANTLPSRAFHAGPSSGTPTVPAGASPGGGERPAIFPPPPPADGEIEELVERVCQGNLKAVQDLARIGAPSLPRVMARFPGPVISERAGPSSRASECGPLLQALAAMGSTAMPSITQSSEHEDARVRRWATLLLGELPGPEACRAVVQRLADDEPRVHQAALDAARLLLAGPAADLFRTTLFEVAEAEDAPLTLRLRTLEHVAKLKDSASVPRLLAFLAADMEPIVHKALWALTVVTRHDFGRDAAAWTDFWEANQGRHRLEWMIDALDQSDPRLRRAAADELRDEAGETFGYSENLPHAARLEAQARFRAWWEVNGAPRQGEGA